MNGIYKRGPWKRGRRQQNRWSLGAVWMMAIAAGICGLSNLQRPNTLRAEDDFADQLPRIPFTPADETLKHFTVAEGFEIELAASEPLVNSPVAVEWDALGRMFVCEMRGYSEDRDDGISRVSRLEDRDGDGVYEHHVTFADGLLWPTAIFPFKNGLFVADAPHIYFFRDTDDDGVADEKQIVLTGFNTSNVQGLLNSFRWGLDNRIHVACGTVGGKVRRWQDPESTAVEVRGRDIAFDPDTYQFERTSGGAQHGMCFDDWGHKFASSNSDHIQQIVYEDRYVARNPDLKAPPARQSIAVDGPQAEVFRTSPVEPWRILRTRLRVSGEVRGVVEGGGRPAGYFTGATGITIYRGDAWPERWLQTAIVGDVGSNLIHRKRLVTDGIVFDAQRIDPDSEFVTSRDIWFRPAQFANAPDGCLHVVDVCREVIEHPASLPPQIKKHLDLTAGRNAGRIYRIKAEGHQRRADPNLRDASTAQLVTTLSHPNAWHRETAARLLYERRDSSAVPGLRETVTQGDSARGRMHALYALSGLGALDETVLVTALGDTHPQVRRHAARLSEPMLAESPEALVAALLDLVEDPSLEVRFQVAFTLGYLPPEQRLAPLGRLLQNDHQNRWMQMAVLSSLGEYTDRLFIEQSQQMGAEAGFLLDVLGQRIAQRAQDDPRLNRALEDLLAQLREVATDSDAPLPRRRAAVEQLRLDDFASLEPLFAELLHSSQPADLQQQTLQTMGTFRKDAVASMMLDVWDQLSPRLRETAFEVLFSRPQFALALLDRVEAGELSVMEIPVARLQWAKKSPEKSLAKRAASLLEKRQSGGAVDSDRSAVLARYRPVLEQAGDVSRGRMVFRKHCAACHAAEGVGHETGPKLATLQARGREAILVNLLDPNREVNPQYVNYIVLTADGRTLTGMIVSESANSITLLRGDGASDTVLRQDIEELQSTGVSLMPEGLEENLDQQDVADLLEYLMQLK
ncbi:PVC-type heme-binding CxxCH protein [Roseimaritima sediminicola]|uniref:PVC-type heme-binding CxxCH protein n=1 Tax=Roseimaritima sediminicola TaxID=2662066 RepID=UPI0012985898|nr:PVC-type heme-binding CxxCH protein [Roseimaritima sediminicola]